MASIQELESPDCVADARQPCGRGRLLARIPAPLLWLGVAVGAAVVLVPVAMSLLFGTPLRQTLVNTGKVLRLEQPLDDSWGPMDRALDCALRQQGELLYQTVFFRKHIKFQYPPTALLALFFIRSPDGLWWISLGFLGVAFWCSWQIFRQGLDQAGELRPGPSRRLHLLLAAAMLILTLTFYPVVKALTLGQIQVWINSLFAVLLWCWLTQRKKTAGFLLGLMCLIKPHYGIILVWGGLRKQWGFVLAATATGMLGLMVSLSLFGVANHLDYLSVLSFIGRHGESYHANQSVNGLLHRLLFNGNNVEWNPRAFAPFHPVVYAGTLLSTLALLALALFGPQRRSSRGSALDLCLAALAATMASPVAWEHHYGVLLPIYAFLFPYLWAQEPSRRWTLPLLGLSYLLTANFYPAANELAETPFNFLQSYLLAGAALVLLLLYHSSKTTPTRLPSPFRVKFPVNANR
jgi:alpha-1,2-mannosyltransferase